MRAWRPQARVRAPMSPASMYYSDPAWRGSVRRRTAPAKGRMYVTTGDIKGVSGSTILWCEMAHSRQERCL